MHDKIYIGSLETLLATLLAMAKALRHAQSTFDALQDTRRHATAEEIAQHAAGPNLTFLFESIAHNIVNVHGRLKQIASLTPPTGKGSNLMVKGSNPTVKGEIRW